jgi:type-F conjugative transfer system pilin assembly protein TrbC
MPLDAQRAPTSVDAAQHDPANPDAPTSTENGATAMERLRGAIARGKDSPPIAGPANIPKPPDAMRRRAFESMRLRAPAPAMDARARVSLRAGEEALAAERERQAKRIAQALGLEAPELAEVAKAAAPGSNLGRVPVLFVSSSMPLATLRAYAAQLERVGGVLAFRGMPGGLTWVQPMAKLSAAILRLDPGCDGPACTMRNVQLIVDPLVFRQHGVAQVPALAMIPGDPTQPYCERDDDASAPRSAHLVYGDAALSGLLEEYARLGGDKEVRDAQARLGSR